MKIIVKIFAIALVCLGLAGCGDESGNVINKSDIPVYTGVSLEQASSKSQIKKQSYDEIIPDIGVTSDVSYFVKPNEKVTVKIGLNNPKDFEILSLTIDNVKYQSFQFKESSTGNTIKIDMVSPQNAGEYAYNIDKIKYIDGTKIKDVDMSKASKKLTFGVCYTSYADVKIKEEKYGPSTYKGTIAINDPESMLKHSTDLKIYAFDESNKIVESAKVIDNRFELNKLEQDTKYHIVFAVSLDILDGKGAKTLILYEKDIITSALVILKIDKIIESTCEYTVHVLNDEVVLKDLILKDGDKEEVIESTGLIEGLLLNHSYELILKLDYQNKEYIIRREIKTLEKKAPVVNDFVIDSSARSIHYSYELEDTDDIVLEAKLELSLHGKAIADSEKNSYEFKNLLSNNEYDLELKIKYDLLDGKGEQVLLISKSIKTKQIMVPELKDNRINSTSSTLASPIEFKSLEANPVVKKVELFKGDTLIATKEEFSFTNLEPFQAYQVKITVAYDINEGKGEEIKVFTFDAKTSSELKLTNLKLLNEGIIKLGSYVNLSFTLDKNVSISEISINGMEASDIKQNGLEVEIEIFNNGLFMGGETTIVVDYVVGTFNNITYHFDSINLENDKLFINGEIKVLDIKVVTDNLEEVENPLGGEALKLLLSLNNPTGYELTEVSLFNVYNDNITKINNNLYTVDLYINNTWGGIDLEYIIFKSPSYEGRLENINATYYKEVHFSDSPHHVKKPEDLFNVQNTCAILDNDIDFTGFDLMSVLAKNDTGFISFIEGNNHTFKNLTFNESIILNGNQNDITSIGIFKRFRGTIRNLKVENFKINAKFTSKTNTLPCVTAGFLVASSENIIFENVIIEKNNEISIKVNGGIATRTGGLVGSADGLVVKNCINKGNVYGIGCVGGFAGESYQNSKIINSINEGNIGAKNLNEAKIMEQNIGGFVGMGGNLVIRHSANKGKIIAKECAAGLVFSCHNAIVDRCYNSGKIEVLNFGAVGLMGNVFDNFEMFNCYNTGDIISGHESVGLCYGNTKNTRVYNCFNTGKVKSNNMANGLIRFSQWGNKEGWASLFNCFNFGAVEGAAFEPPYDTYNLVDDFTKEQYSIARVYSFYGNLGATVKKNGISVSLESLNDKDFYIQKLRFDESIWNLDDLNFVNGKFPTLK